MPKFKKYVQLENGALSNDPSNPLFNYYSANFFYLENQITHNEKLSDDTEINIVLLPNGVITATLPDGRVISNG